MLSYAAQKAYWKVHHLWRNNLNKLKSLKVAQVKDEMDDDELILNHTWHGGGAQKRPKMSNFDSIWTPIMSKNILGVN